MNHQIPDWKVYFDGNFWGHFDDDQAATELSIRKHFYWDNEKWIIPSIYSCPKGLVIDFIKQVPVDKIRHFIEKWHLDSDSDCNNFNDEQLLLIQIDNPLTTEFQAEPCLNDQKLAFSHSCGICWNPLLPEGNSSKIQEVIRHYDLDPAFGWAVCRSSFLWENNTPQIRSLTIQMLPKKQEIPGPHFHTKASGDQIQFTHPTTGMTHTLTVQEYITEQTIQELNSEQNIPMHTSKRNMTDSLAKEFPDCFTMIGYTITPALPPLCLTLADCANSDRPRIRQTPPLTQDPCTYTDTDIIGGADGPTSIFISNSGLSHKLLYAVSAVHFQPAKDVEWRMIFHEQTKSEICIDLI